MHESGIELKKMDKVWNDKQYIQSLIGAIKLSS